MSERFPCCISYYAMVVTIRIVPSEWRLPFTLIWKVPYGYANFYYSHKVGIGSTPLDLFSSLFSHVFTKSFKVSVCCLPNNHTLRTTNTARLMTIVQIIFQQSKDTIWEPQICDNDNTTRFRCSVTEWYGHAFHCDQLPLDGGQYPSYPFYGQFLDGEVPSMCDPSEYLLNISLEDSW